MPENEEAGLSDEVEVEVGDAGAEVEVAEPQYVIEIDGVDVPCDANGTPLEVEAEAVEPVVAADTPEPRRETEYTSPYAGQPAGDETVTLTRAELQQMMRQEIANDRVASAQQQRAARELGVPDEVFSALSPFMAQAEAMVPPQLKGTKQGATMTLYAAMALDSESNGFDVGKTLAKFAQQQAPAAKPAVQRLPPSQVAASPRPSPAKAAPRRVQTPYDAAAQSVGGADVLELIRKERKVYR